MAASPLLEPGCGRGRGGRQGVRPDCHGQTDAWTAEGTQLGPDGVGSTEGRPDRSHGEAAVPREHGAASESPAIRRASGRSRRWP